MAPALGVLARHGGVKVGDMSELEQNELLVAILNGLKRVGEF